MNIRKFFLNKKTLIIVLSGIFILVGFFLMERSLSPSATIQSPSAYVQVATVQLKSMAQTLVTYGVVAAVPEETHQVTTQNEVLVQKIFVTQGQRVSKGDPLLQVSLSTAATLNFENTKTSIKFAKKELDRLKHLRQQYLATNAEVEIANQNLIKAEAQLVASKFSQDGGEQIFKAPQDSIIVFINAQPGQVIASGAPLLTFADHAHVQVRLGIESEDLPRIQIGQKVVIVPIHNDAAVLTGHIQNMTGQIDSTTGLVSVIVPLENASALILGTMVRGEVFLEPETKKIVVPRSAVLYEKNKAYVFVDNHGKAEQRFITTAEEDDNQMVVTHGLQGNEQIVIVGNYELQNGMALRLEHP